MKNKLSQATRQPIDKNLPFTVENHAPDFAIAATLNQTASQWHCMRGLFLYSI